MAVSIDSGVRDDLIEALRRADSASIESRADRILWLASFNVPVSALWPGLELPIFMEEARTCFVNGEFVACVVLCNAFAEHALVYRLVAADKPAENSHATNIKRAAQADLFPVGLLDNARELNRIRNAYAHTTREGVPKDGSLSDRFISQRAHPKVIMEADAQLAMRLINDLLPHILE